MRINICFACDDDDYLQHLFVAIVSIIHNTSFENQLNFYILTNYMSEESRNKMTSLMKKNCKIEYIKVDKAIFESSPLVCDWTNIQTYYRLIMATLLCDIDKIIYLDSDLVVNADITELFEQDIENYYAAGVNDIRYYHVRDGGHDRFYANAGVLVFNLKKIREDEIEQKFFDFIAENKTNGLLLDQDQGVINEVLADKFKHLDYKWNVQSFTFVKNATKFHPLRKNMELAKKNPAIVHFTGGEKPWFNYAIPYAELYFKYLQYTPFKYRINRLEFYTKKLRKQFKYLLRHPFFFIEDKISMLPLVIE